MVDLPGTVSKEHAIEADVQRLGRELLKNIQKRGAGIFDAQYWQGRLLDWAMHDASFKTDLFRFVDVLPTLQTAEQVKVHVREYLLKPERPLPKAIAGVLKVASSGIGSHLATSRIRGNVEGLARRFIAGQDSEEASKVLEALWRQGLGFSVDALGEACLSEREADRYAAYYRSIIHGLVPRVAQWKSQPVQDRNHVGTLPRVNLSIKISSLYSQADVVDVESAVSAINARLVPLCVEAKAQGAFINLDMEDWQWHEITYAVFEKLVCHEALRHWPHLGVVLQAYLRVASEDLRRLRELARKRGTPFTVRLVKGAYWDVEVLKAKQQGWTCPVLQDKAATDASYEKLCEELLDAVDDLWPAFASHNIRSLSYAVCAAERRGIPLSAYELQVLYGMAEAERAVLCQRGHRVRVYAPIGELLPGMAYLVRRLLENTSNESFVRLYAHDQKSPEELLMPPRPRVTVHESATSEEADLNTPFVNCPATDFTDISRKQAFAQAMAEMPKSFPRNVPVMISGKPRRHDRTITRTCPYEPSITVATVSMADASDVNDALLAATQAWPAWNQMAVKERAMLLERLGEQLQKNRDALAALISWEVGKPWYDADAEVAEAVDFCRYYARQALAELDAHLQAALPGEINWLSYEGRGVAVVIAPWNFPLAILCGMTTAALVAGNTVLMKPAEQASAVGHALYEHMREVGFPPDVIHCLPGIGEEVGPWMVNDPRVATIAFTGSKAVGLRIREQASATKPGQRHIKRVVSEMGGKNAIIVDEDADLDEAILETIESAFGYAGQKCSACSRILVLDSIYDEFKTRLIAATESLCIGPAHEPSTKVGPVIDEETQARLLSVLGSLPQGVTSLYQSRVPQSGCYVPCAILEISDPNHMLMQEELFGPIVALYRAKDFAHALDVAVGTDYALTGAVFSRMPSHLEQAKRDFRVGNLYLNRGCTGALVFRQPFGGFAMSGGGIKAGGPGYLREFADARCVTENTQRRGFAPESLREC